jgi:hypothetical protein
MPEPDLIELFVHPLGQLGVRYLVSGSVAAMLYGEPRVTHDVDLIVFLRYEDIPRLSEVFPAPEFYLPPLNVMAEEIARERRGHFNIIHADSALKADIYPANRDELHAWAFRNKKSYVLSGRTIALAPPEYVIVRKLEYYREGGSEKHVRDIRSMLAVSGGSLDREALDGWIGRRGLEAEWQRASSETSRS